MRVSERTAAFPVYLWPEIPQRGLVVSIMSANALQVPTVVQIFYMAFITSEQLQEEEDDSFVE